MSENKLELVNQFIEQVKHIVNKPGMYQVNNIEDLGLIVLGYLMGITHMEKEEELSTFLVGFISFVNRHFDTTFDYDWERLIRFNSSGDRGSLNLFKDLFEEYINSSH